MIENDKKKTGITRIMCLVVIACVYTFLFILTTSAGFNLHNVKLVINQISGISMTKLIICFATILLLILSICAVVRELLVSAKDRNSILVFVLKVLMVFWCVYHTIIMPGTYIYNATILVLISIVSYFCNEDDLMRIPLIIGMTILTGSLFLSLAGIVDNVGGNSFGIVYHTDYACHILCLVLAFCFLKNGWLTWIEEIGLIAVCVFVICAANGKTAFLCILTLIIITTVRHCRALKKIPFQDRQQYGFFISTLFKIIYLPAIFLSWIIEKTKLSKCKAPIAGILKYIFVIMAGLSFLLALTYRQLQGFWNAIPGFATASDRMLYSLIGLEEFSFSFTGNAVDQIGSGASENVTLLYYYLDNAYIKLYLEYGFIFLSIIIAIMTVIQFRLYKKKRYYAMVLISLIALDGFFEFGLINYSYNCFAALAFCSLSKKPELKHCDKHNLAGFTVRKKSAFIALSALIIVICGLWISTAYQITTWRGHTPTYKATVVVPGSFLEAESSYQLYLKRRTEAKNFLIDHEEAECIVSTETDKEWLVGNFVGEDRIYILPFSSVEEMLVESEKLIESKNLPSRLTVCAYDIQQARIKRYADALHIPINSISLDMSGFDYVINFAAEQWRLLWKEQSQSSQSS